CQQYISLPFTF
nr:immunoglobulin light chain junction region [Macaca mulatta]